MTKAEYVIKYCINKDNTINDIGRELLKEENHIEKGYKSNTGRERCIRKNGTFDYLKMSKLYHEGKW